MANWKEGDAVRVVSRAVTEEDRKNNAYYAHMAGLSGIVQNVYEGGAIAIKIEKSSMSDVTRDVHRTAVERMRAKFEGSISEEHKKLLTAEEMNFDAHYILLVQERDLEQG